MAERTIILGAGMSGLGAALVSGRPAFEAAGQCGGACHSYYRTIDGVPRAAGEDVADCFRFEPAGGHWLFGATPPVLARLRAFGRFREYRRRAAVFFPEEGRFVPYPLQENLRYLDPNLRARILDELAAPQREPAPGATFDDWLRTNFGPTLCEIFFLPFNERYTAGQLRDIAPQDSYKSPVDLERLRQGAREPVARRGYNDLFHYPEQGLDQLVSRMSAGREIHFEHRVVAVDPFARRVAFENGRSLSFDRTISTVPLDAMARMCGLQSSQPPDPATAVLVVNIVARKGKRCPPYHWVYLPASRSGLHRVGFYSNVDVSFLPTNYAAKQELVSLYAERSYLSTGETPGAERIAAASRDIVAELKQWEFIDEALIVEPTFTDPAYTWNRPHSSWAQETIQTLATHGIKQIGRYGAWRFQGMVASFEEGIAAGARAAA